MNKENLRQAIKLAINEVHFCKSAEADQIIGAIESTLEELKIALVPVEPTDEMMMAAMGAGVKKETVDYSVGPKDGTSFYPYHIYKAALNASPYRAYDERSENKAVKHAVKHSPKERKQNANGGISD